MSAEQLQRQEDRLRDEIGDLPAPLRKHYYQLEQKSLKDPDTYAVLNYFFVCGLHHFYLNKPLFGFLNLIVMLIGVIFWEMFGWVLVLIVIAVELPQLFRSQNIVKKYNLDVMQRTLNEVRRELED